MQIVQLRRPGRCAGKSISTQGCICASSEISHHSPGHRGPRPVESLTRASSEASEACRQKRPYCAIHQVGLTNLGKTTKTTKDNQRPVFLSELPLFPFLFLLLFIFLHLFREKVWIKFQFPFLFAKKPDVLRPSRAWGRHQWEPCHWQHPPGRLSTRASWSQEKSHKHTTNGLEWIGRTLRNRKWLMCLWKERKKCIVAL